MVRGDMICPISYVRALFYECAQAAFEAQAASSSPGIPATVAFATRTDERPEKGHEVSFSTELGFLPLVRRATHHFMEIDGIFIASVFLHRKLNVPYISCKCPSIYLHLRASTRPKCTFPGNPALVVDIELPF